MRGLGRTLAVCAALIGMGQGAHAQGLTNGLAGAYLAARSASFDFDYEAAASYYAQALARDPSNPTLLENAVTSYVGLGDFTRAAAIARKMQADGLDSQIANMVIVSEHFRNGEFDAVFDDLEAGLSIGPLVDGLVAAWAHVGAGRMSAALEEFDAVAKARGTRDFGLYHKALALGLVGDYETADSILSGEAEGPISATRNGVIAHAQILSQLERNGDAIELLDSVFGAAPDPAVKAMLDQLEAGEVLAFNSVDTASDGLSEAFFNVGGILETEASPSYALIYVRVSLALEQDNVAALLLCASLLEELDRPGLATEVYDSVPRDHPSFYVAEMGRADALYSSGKVDTAIEVLRSLADTHPELAVVHNALGETLRAEERFGEAQAAYDEAIALFSTPAEPQWRAYYARGITHERQQNWPAAEADFREALELRPGQPYVLNYLGYSLVERREKLEEALELIEEAVAGRPNDGFITDSLGWALYRLGRYDEAVVHMERAVELEPVDPIITDHFGDTLWAVGRKREARFQWRRALSFDPEPEEAERILKKLEVGLDQVLREEEDKPLSMANDNG